MKIKVSTEIDGYLKADHLKISTTSIESVDVGEIVWNQVDGTFDMGLIGGVTLQAGQEMHIYGKATEAISNGESVMFAGVQGDHLLIARADATIINANPEYLIGVSTQSFAINDFGYVTTLGNVRGLNTLAYTLGTILYYNSESTTDGLLTATEPTAPNAKIEVAAVVKVHGTQGILLVRPHVMPRVKDLQDIHAPSPTQAKGLFWNNTNSRYENYTVPEILGYTPANDSDVVHISGYETITGAKTFNDYSIYKGSLILSQTTSAQSVPGYMSLSGTTSGINLYDGSNVTRSVNLKVSNVSTLRNIEFPNASGTLALTSDLSLYALDSNVVHLTGNETITGIKTFNGTLNTTTSIFNLEAVDNFPTGGVPDSIRSAVKGHNGTSGSLVSCLYGLIENNKNAGVAIENLDTMADATNSVGVRIKFKSTSTTNDFYIGRRGDNNVFRVNDYGDIYGTKTILGTTVDNGIDTLQVNGSARIVNIDSTGIGGITTKLLSYSADPYGLVFRAYATGEHSIQNQRESNDATVFPLSLQPLGGNLGVGTLTPVGKFNVFTGISGNTFDIVNQQNGSISFSNRSVGATTPTISGKSGNGPGLTFFAGTSDVNISSDISFNTRKTDNTDFTTLTTSAYRFSRFETTLIDVLRNGNTTFYGNIYAPAYYDSSNTIYYVKPANSSTLRYLNTTDGVSAPIYYDSSDTTYSVNPASTSRLNILNVVESLSAPIYYDSSDTTYYVNPASTSRLAYLNVTERIDAPIYYDSNWTAYYVNPASVSRLYALEATSYIYAPILYDYNNSSYYFDGTNTSTSIRVAGGIQQYYSDERLKDIKNNIENPLEKVLSLNGFYYEPNEIAQSFGYVKKMEVGVSAQEVEAILPEIIQDAPIGHGYKTLDYSKLVPLLIEAIKEQQTQIEELKNKFL